MTTKNGHAEPTRHFLLVLGQRVHSTDYRYSIVINDTMDVPDVSGSISMMWALQALRETQIRYALLSVPEKQKKAGHQGPEFFP